MNISFDNPGLAPVRGYSVLEYLDMLYGAAGGGGSGGRTATVSWAPNGGLDAMGNYHALLTITYSDGKVINKPVMIAWNAVVGDQETMMNQLVAETQLILDTDISYFDELIRGDYHIVIEKGSDIADGYYARNPDKVNNGKPLAGLHTSKGKNSATFKIASELFKNGGHPAFCYEYSSWPKNNTERLKVWESFAHELGHQLDYIKYGKSFFTILTFDGKEISTIDRVNILRQKNGRNLEIYKKTGK